jgi:hypothetical protein
MPTAVVPTAVWQNSTLTVPNNGEDVNQSSLLDTHVQKMANSSEFLAARWRTIWVPPGLNQNTDARFVVDAFGRLTQSSIASAGLVNMPIPAGVKGKITGVTAYAQAAGGHGALPATAPAFQLWRSVPSTNTLTQISITASDPSASVAAYEAIHNWTLGPLTETIDATRQYFLVVTGETGASSVLGYKFTGIAITISEV